MLVFRLNFILFWTNLEMIINNRCIIKKLNVIMAVSVESNYGYHRNSFMIPGYVPR